MDAAATSTWMAFPACRSRSRWYPEASAPTHPPRRAMLGRRTVVARLATHRSRGDILASVAWMALAFCVLAALVSFFRARHSGRVLDTRVGCVFAITQTGSMRVLRGS